MCHMTTSPSPSTLPAFPSALDEVPDDERRDSVRIPPDRERETTADEALLRRLLCRLRGGVGFYAERRQGGRGGQERFVPEDAGRQDGFLVGAECDVAVFLQRTMSYARRYKSEEHVYLPVVHG